MKLYNIRVLLNRANCWNFQIDKRNLDITVSVLPNRLFFYDLLIILLGAKRITIINVAPFLKKTLFMPARMKANGNFSDANVK